MPGPAQMGLQNLADIHARGHAQRVEHDFHRRAVGQERHIFFRQNAGQDALVAVAAGHLIANGKLALHGDVDLHHPNDAGREFISLLELGDALVGEFFENLNLPNRHLFDVVDKIV